MKFLVLTSINLVVCALLSACASNAPKVASSSLRASVDIPTAIIGARAASASVHVLQWYSPLWDPTTNQVMEAVEKIPDYLAQSQRQKSLQSRNSSYLPGLEQRLPRTVCQALGVSFERKQGVLLNFLPESEWGRDLEKRFIKTYDTGPAYWSVIYLVDSGTFTNLYIIKGSSSVTP